MPNNRVFYASQAVAVGQAGGGATTIRGAQSVGVTTNFNLEQAFQLGQLALYDNIVVDPEVEVTVSKVLDGEHTIWYNAVGGGSIIDNANQASTVIIGVGSDTAATITSSAAITMTGMYVSSLTYTFPVDGNFTEDVTFVGNNKSISGTVNAPGGTGIKVARRQNLDISSSSIPSEVSGKNITNITISADLGRESMYKLGEYAPFHRFVNFPLEVTCEFEVSATSNDGVAMDLNLGTCPVTTGLPQDQAISISVCSESGSSYTFNLGSKCKLTSVNYTGGDTGGGNATITYSYSTYNDLDITN